MSESKAMLVRVLGGILACSAPLGVALGEFPAMWEASPVGMVVLGLWSLFLGVVLGLLWPDRPEPPEAISFADIDALFPDDGVRRLKAEVEALRAENERLVDLVDSAELARAIAQNDGARLGMEEVMRMCDEEP